MTKFGYHRVSTKKQELENGIYQLKEKTGILEENIFYEKMSGKTSKNRTQLNLLLSQVKQGDEVYVLKIDRLARSIIDLNTIVQELQSKGVSITFLAENMTFDDKKINPMSQFTFNMLGAFAEFERSIIVNRMEEGKAYKLETDPDFRLGRKKKYTPKQLEHAIKLLDTNSYTEVESLTGISKSTLIRKNRELKASKS